MSKIENRPLESKLKNRLLVSKIGNRPRGSKIENQPSVSKLKNWPIVSKIENLPLVSKLKNWTLGSKLENRPLVSIFKNRPLVKTSSPTITNFGKFSDNSELSFYSDFQAVRWQQNRVLPQLRGVFKKLIAVCRQLRWVSRQVIRVSWYLFGVFQQHR